LVAVDATGEATTGDELLALFASDLAGRGRLAGNTVVVTVMSNLGLRHAMAEKGITVRETPIGDRYVLEALNADGLTLGGEQSGHLVFRELATTGDGLLTGVLLLDLLRRTGRPLADLAREAMRRLPQVLENVAVAHPAEVVDSPDVQAEVAAVTAELEGRGRVLLRASGTEPLVRVMVEAVDDDLAQDAVARLCAVVARVSAPRTAPPEGAAAASGPRAP
jgi:phosphoglucosamine mutase